MSRAVKGTSTRAKYQHGYVSPEASASEAQRYAQWAREREARQIAKHGAAWVETMMRAPSLTAGKVAA